MRKIILMASIMLIFFTSQSQQIVDLEENSPFTYNGLEYGFYITNERSKEVKGEDYDRYEVSLYVTNKSGCIKLIPFKTTLIGKAQYEEVVVAEFNCKNATGKRLTAKTGKIN